MKLYWKPGDKVWVAKTSKKPAFIEAVIVGGPYQGFVPDTAVYDVEYEGKVIRRAVESGLFATRSECAQVAMKNATQQHEAAAEREARARRYMEEAAGECQFYDRIIQEAAKVLAEEGEA